MISYQQHQVAEEALELAINLNASHFYVDTSAPGNEIDRWPSDRISALYKCAVDAAVTPIVHGDGTAAIAHHLKPVRDGALECVYREIELASKLDTTYILHGGQLYTTLNIQSYKNQALEHVAQSCRSIQEHANKYGIEVWLENLSGFSNHLPFFNMITKKEHFEYIINEVPDMNIILDVGHYHISGEPVGSFFDKFHSRIKAISLSDNDGVRDMHAPLGAGNIDWLSIKTMMEKYNWNGVLIFETKSIQPKEDYDYFMGLNNLSAIAS